MRSVKQISYNRSSRDNKEIKYIVIHDTGNPTPGADAIAHYNYFNTGNRSSSADFFVDDSEILCVNDYYKYYTWHCGDGSGKYGISNANSIGIEICINADGDYQRAVDNTVKLTKELMQELDIPIECVVRHYDASRKRCPYTMSYDDWSKWFIFKQRLIDEEELTVAQYEELKSMISELSDKIPNPMIYNYIDKNMPDFAKPTIQKLCDKGLLKGDSDGLNLDYNMLRMLVILDRAGVFD